MRLEIPQLSVVVLVGPSGCGKSTFAAKHFLPTEVVSSDYCRGVVSDDENDQSATNDAFELLHFIVQKRLAAGRLTVVDATNVQPESRKALLEIARRNHVLAVALVFMIHEDICHERNKTRADRQFGPHVVRNQMRSLKRSLKSLQREGFHVVHVLRSPEEIERVSIERTPLWSDKKSDLGPFDIIGDVHGCYLELTGLLERLGYETREGQAPKPPAGRKAIFLGDLVDRGPDSPSILRLVMSMVEAGDALCVPGNHDIKLLRKLRGRDVQITHGLDKTLEQLASESDDFKEAVAGFIDSLVSHYVLDEGRLVVAHAGMSREMQGRGSAAVRDFALFGETTGETDDFGMPVRFNWAAEYRGEARVVYGHTPVPEAEWLNRTINIDTGCVFGGKLTALRYPELELIEVPAKAVYAEPSKPFLEVEPALLTAQQREDELLDLADVRGKRFIGTRLRGNITLREENATAALEAMSRFAANPKWLVYLPPTMSPSETSRVEGLLEHPAEAFGYFASNGIAEVICEEKHMGSRAVVAVCRDESVARRVFGVHGERGIVYTRTGRRFFDDSELEIALIERLDIAVEKAGLWSELETDWLILDCELMPWSAKAQELLRKQYAPVGAAGIAASTAASAALEMAKKRHPQLDGAAEQMRKIAASVVAYINSYRQYCWPVQSLNDLKLAPFHLLASAGGVHCDKDHVWHMDTIARICDHDPILTATPFTVVKTLDEDSTAKATSWWEDMVSRGGEGMVVKPRDFVARGPKGLVQPAIKCRGPEYLRIIYGPEYDLPEHLERLRRRGLGAKRSLALREFALGVEALERFARKEPLRRVHECVFGVLALESEPVDPRL